MVAYGAVFGVPARQAGLSLLEVVLMSAVVAAGASQFVAVGMWAAPLPVASIVLTTLVVNLRHLLMGAALRPWFGRLPRARAYGSLFFLSDESWALTTRALAKGEGDGAFLAGSGVVLDGAWLLAGAAGYLLGATLGDPGRWGLDFAFTAVFVALLVGSWTGKADLLPWGVAAATAVAADALLPGTWYVLVGGLAGSAVGGWRGAR